MKQVLVRRGQIVVEETPAPEALPGTVLVRVDHSCISPGTELSSVRASGTPLWKKAVTQPAKVRKAVDMVRTDGLSVTKATIEGRFAAGQPTGYSAAGTVVAVGDGITDLAVGTRVACAGAQAAHHAEAIAVPRNLVVPVPEGLPFGPASTVTLGAIALQGVRRATPTLGETFVVIGLGLIGQLTAQILRANGCRVIVSDLDQARVALATGLGADAGLDPADDAGVATVERLTGGIGADGVIITASSSSDAIVSTAFRMTRRKGRVVLVGDVGLGLDRADMYAKELDFFVSTSYGPGRYDASYEEDGVDYPIGYVRWTENRNMAEYLRLLADGAVRLDGLISETFPVDDAASAFAALDDRTRPGVAVLLAYPARPADGGGTPSRVVANPNARPGKAGALRVALVGAGGFAKGMHLPNIRSLPDDFHLQAVVSRSGHNASATATTYGAAYATTDYERVLDDPDIDLVVIATRHDRHASMTLAALERGKHVLVEKPLALTEDELARIVSFYDAASLTDAPVLLTGFNRRFSPYGRRLAELTATRSNPMILDYRMNAGHIAADHWVQTAEGGGRNRGEACHIYDLFTYLTGAKVVDVSAMAIAPRTDYYLASDNFAATLRFDDGSVATLTYTALGSAEHPKERLEVYVDGSVLALDDYRQLTVTGRSAKDISTSTSDKGQKAELVALAKAIRDGGEWPIPLWQQVQATRIALAVEPFLDGSR